MNFTIESPEFVFTWKWLVELLERIFKDVFGFIAEEEGWVEEEAAPAE